MNNISTFLTPDLLATAAADLIVQLAAEHIAKKGKFTIALSGGSTPNALFTILASDAYRKKIDLKHTFIFWVDERCVPLNSDENNSHVAKQLWLDNVSIPKENIFVIPVNETPTNAAIYYEATIKIFFKSDKPSFDLILLGMGNDGHTASLFPNSSILNETSALVKNVYVEAVKMNRITLTPPLINAAKHILFLVAGSSKADILHTVLHNKIDTQKYPAQLIKNAMWFVTEDAVK